MWELKEGLEQWDRKTNNFVMKWGIFFHKAPRRMDKAENKLTKDKRLFIWGPEGISLTDF